MACNIGHCRDNCCVMLQVHLENRWAWARPWKTLPRRSVRRSFGCKAQQQQQQWEMGQLLQIVGP